MSLRGAQIPPWCSRQDLEALLENNAKLIRYEMLLNPTDSTESWESYMTDHVNHIESVILPAIKEYPKARLIPCMMTPPEGRVGDVELLFCGRPDLEDAVFRAWQRLMLRLEPYAQVLAYDLLNEPAAGKTAVQNVYTRLIRRVRPLTNKRLIVSSPYGSTATYPIDTIQGANYYTVHIYDPLTYTHQAPGSPVRYTAAVKDKLKAGIARVRSWQRKKKAIIYVGEFSCNIYASPNDRLAYIKDVLYYCNRYDWHHTYHAFRESPLWSAEVYPPLLNTLIADWMRD